MKLKKIFVIVPKCLIKPRGLENKFSFLSPHISQEDKQGQQIADILLTHKFKNKLIFAPVNLGLNHWVLLVINPGAEMIYYMDSLPGGHPNIDVVRKKFMNAMCICRSLNPKLKSKSSIIPWKEIKCPMQTNDIDCGYFVMRFMKEIILANQDMIPENYFGDYKCKTYSKDKLVEVEEDWATFMVEYLRDYIAQRLTL
ncbi:uncharacterized protein [Medicago truncatula]|uniref:uncharacterized protein isoform X2 n=1 Tax=Medicago truncatula TaxID=3880 RepID=UPI0019685076|nr:uncharacterized protein LOC112421680 isoform X2 [Medicago truncatula]